MRLNVPCLSSAVVACSSRRRPGLTTHYAGIFPQTSGWKAWVGEKSAWKVSSLAFGARWPQNTTINTSAIAAPTTEFLDTTTTANNSLTATHTTTTYQQVISHTMGITILGRNRGRMRDRWTEILEGRF
ncbi:hypothetical protein L208DRAFT_818371 [Tricholoma matsutake]|nr:hypothetical protein L208DRAFT_818371 [Tricholoma matsutake 945]